MSTTTESATSSKTAIKEGVEIKGKDVIKLNAPEILPPEGQLLTEAQDIVGAINELKKGLDEGGGGESDKWVRPSDWPVMPEPADNQIVILISTQWSFSPYESFTVYAYKSGETAVNFDGTTSVSVNWGDGYSDTINLPSDVSFVSPGRYYYDYDETTGEKLGWHDGPVLDNGAHVFVITITLPDNAYFYMNGNCEPLEIYVGKNVKFFNSVINSQDMLEHVKFFGWQPTDENHVATNYGLLYNCRVLKCVDATEPLVYLPERAFNTCYNLKEIDLSQCTEIGAYGLYNTDISEIISEKLHTINTYALGHCHNLKRLDTPNLLMVERYALDQCYNLESVTHAEDWTYTASDFRYSFYKWYDNPEMSHPQIP